MSPIAIVRSGNEPERYVRVGDRIAGGSVRVKRIETVAFEPRVILEENGIEVSRPIEANSGAPEATPAADDSVAITPGSVSSMASVTAQPGTLPTASSIPALPTLPTIPTVPGLRSLQPTSSNLPNSLLLPSAHTSSQAIVPNFRVSVPAV
ncbi:MAG: hypothetical protein HC800_12150 [Phormidesmis sp. RL_2_1]|nr:hypothetical protein [Phormidesmis sp. RL_2_1]